jgi:hypothetical protein
MLALWAIRQGGGSRVAKVAGRPRRSATRRQPGTDSRLAAQVVVGSEKLSFALAGLAEERGVQLPHTRLFISASTSQHDAASDRFVRSGGVGKENSIQSIIVCLDKTGACIAHQLKLHRSACLVLHDHRTSSDFAPRTNSRATRSRSPLSIDEEPDRHIWRGFSGRFVPTFLPAFHARQAVGS